MLWRAFDKTVRRKPLAFAADAVYGNSIDLAMEVIARKGVAGKAWLFQRQVSYDFECSFEPRTVI